MRLHFIQGGQWDEKCDEAVRDLKLQQSDIMDRYLLSALVPSLDVQSDAPS